VQNAAQRWFKFHNEGSSPQGRSGNAMASDGTRVFVLGGCSTDALVDGASLTIHVFDTSMYFPLVISSGRLPRLRTQITSSTRNPSLTMSILMRRPPYVRGSHPQIPRPRMNHSIWHPLHLRPTILSLVKTLPGPPLYRTALPRRRSLTSETPVQMADH